MLNKIKIITLTLLCALWLPSISIAADVSSPKQGDTLVEPLLNMSFVYIEPGQFTMGSPEDEVDHYKDEAQHEVKVKEGFWMGKYEVTFEQYDAFTMATGRTEAADPNSWGRDDRPVIHVKWFYAYEFAHWLSKQTGHRYRLPTEAEWEYAARAGTATAFSFGEHIHGMDNHSFFKRLLDVGTEGIGEQKILIDQYAWYGENADKKTHPVGQKKPNPWGLYDMHGNVWEWTCSVYSEEYAMSEKCADDPKSNAKRVIRGGAWSFYAKGMRSADRRYYAPANRLSYIGFRLVRED